VQNGHKFGEISFVPRSWGISEGGFYLQLYPMLPSKNMSPYRTFHPFLRFCQESQARARCKQRTSLPCVLTMPGEMRALSVFDEQSMSRGLQE
jgi:hypothetical protein